jgi:NAD+ diphosphatase
MSATYLLRDLALSRSTVDRAAHLRRNDQSLRSALLDPATRVFPVYRASAPIIGGELVFSSPLDFDQACEFVFLGVEGGTSFFCVFVDQAYVDTHNQDSWINLRAIGSALCDRDAGLMVAAVALANWHETHPRCPRCGAATVLADAGWIRRCPEDNSMHFPRTDPAVIMLITDHQDRALLARQMRWASGWMSVLAGFVESGESAEAAVVREISEEAGIEVNPASIQYLGSQPWPFPNSLMLGYQAEVSDRYGSDELIAVTVDGEEIAHAEWFSREQLVTAVKAGELHLPPPVSIAHRLIVNWLGEPLPRETNFR